MAKNLFADEELRDLYERRHLSLTAIAAQKGCHKETVRQYLILFGILRRSVSEAKIRYPRKNFSGDLTEKAYLLGFRAGDLHVWLANHSPTSQTVTVACTSTIKEQIELIQKLFEQYGHCNISVSNGQSVVTFYLDRSFDFLLNDEDRVESWILADANYFAAFLAGYTDAEGSIHVKKSTRASEIYCPRA